MSRNYDAVIFDIDGTLTATNNLIYASFNHIIGKYLNKHFSTDEIIGLFGPTEDKIIEDWFPDIHEQVKNDYYDFYQSNHNMVDVYPGIKYLLDKLKETGIVLAIFTGKGRKAALITLRETGLAAYFDLIVSGDDVINHKPNAEGLINIINAYKLDKERVLMVGDAVADILAAPNAGIKMAAALWDSYAKEKVLKLNSDFEFYTVAELTEHLMS